MKYQAPIISAVVALAAAAAVSTLFVAPAGAGKDNPARTLLEQSVEASGGKEACGSWKTLVAKGELTVHWAGWGTPEAVATLSVKLPDKMVLDQDFSAHDNPFFFTYYYNAGEVWAVVNLGVRQNPRYTRSMTRALKNNQSVYYFLTQCDTMWVVPDVPDDSLFAGSSVDRVGVVDVGDTILVDLDKESHLPVRQIEDRGSQQTLFADWRKANGKLMKPYRVTLYQGGAVSAEYVWKEYSFDVPLDDALFEEFRPAKKASG
jgi:hypothetical protein